MKYSPSLICLPAVHAVLFRPWQQRVKGRDWFELEWSARRGTVLHLAQQIESLDVARARQHIERCIVNPEPLAQ